MTPDAVRPVQDQTALWFGGDYNPEQWPEEIRDLDLVAIDQLGVNTVTLPIFAWGMLQPTKDRFEFGWLDRTLSALDDHGVGVILATPTAAQPAWMSTAYPEILPVDATGRRRSHGGRVNYCPTSSVYRDASARIAEVLAQRYAGFGGLRLWHVNNEYGPTCYCDGCRDEFQRWTRERYGEIDAVNDAWGTAVWGNTLHDWSEIEFPSLRNHMGSTPAESVDFSPNPGMVLDRARFQSRVLLDCFLTEKRVLRAHTPEVPITTNFHGPVQSVDWHEWGPHLDLISWDSYPAADSPWSHASFGHDLARGAGRTPEFLLMETSPGPTNWQPIASLKRPGVTRLQSMQAIARGSRGVMFFQVRQARAGNELNHSALIPRHGRLDTRMGAELTTLGADLSTLPVFPDAHHVETPVAIVFDWPSWWAHHATPGLDQKSRYLDTVRDFHRVLAERGITTDVVSSNDAWTGYDLVVAPGLHLLEPSVAEGCKDFVAGGGTVITTTGSGIFDRAGRVHDGGMQETWSALFGLWVEETDVQPPGFVNVVEFDDGSKADATELFDIIRLDTADPVARYTQDFYAGSPAVTVNRLGEGSAYHLASPTPDLFAALLGRILPATTQLPGTVERVEWSGDVTFLLNHGTAEVEVQLGDGSWIDLLTDQTLGRTVAMKPADVIVAREEPVMTAARRSLTAAMTAMTAVVVTGCGPAGTGAVTPVLGLDLSYVNEMEDCGAVYRDAAGETDPFAILSAQGANLVRARLWHTPDWTEYSTVEDVIRTFERAKAAGMATLLDIHYSDEWADPGRQSPPAAWADTPEEQLPAVLAQYTTEVLTRLEASGVMPDMVQVGNETNGGLVKNAVGIDWERDAPLFAAGIAAVRAASEDIEVVLHVAQPENALDWFQGAEAAGLTDFDVIGLSYYPQWSQFTVAELGSAVARMGDAYNKDVLVVETAYPWTTATAGDTADNVLDQGLRLYPMTPAGQRSFMTDVTAAVVANGGMGTVYWEPAWISTDCSTRWGQGSHWENATLFDLDDTLHDDAGYLGETYSMPTSPDTTPRAVADDPDDADPRADLLSVSAALTDATVQVTAQLTGDIRDWAGAITFGFDTTAGGGDAGRRPFDFVDGDRPDVIIETSFHDEPGVGYASPDLQVWDHGQWSDRTFTGTVDVDSDANGSSTLTLTFPRRLLLDVTTDVDATVFTVARGRAGGLEDAIGMPAGDGAVVPMALTVTDGR